MEKLLTKAELALCKVKQYKKDTVIFHENDNCKYVGIVMEGKVVIKSYLESGKEIIYNTIYKEEMFGNNLLFSSKTKYKGDVIAQSDTTLLLISKESLLIILSQNREFLITYLEKQANYTKHAAQKLKLLSFDSAIERFRYYLDNQNGVIRYKTITSLAKEMNLERETLSRLISKLKKENVIKVDKDTIYRY